MTIIGKDDAIFHDVGARPSYECGSCGFVFAAEHFGNDGTDTCPVCVDVDDAERRERDRIAAWLRDVHNGAIEQYVFDELADCIASGEHLAHLPKPGDGR